MEFFDLRRSVGLSQSQFAEKFGIPLSTYKHWEQKLRTPPPYVMSMMKKIIELESNGDKDFGSFS